MEALSKIEIGDLTVSVGDSCVLKWKDGTTANAFVKRILKYNFFGGTDIHVAYNEDETNKQIPTEPSDVLPFPVEYFEQMIKHNYLFMTKTDL